MSASRRICLRDRSCWLTSKRSGRVVMKYSFPEDRKATIAADWVVESVAGAGRRALRRHGETERCVSIVSWPDRIELALRTAAGTAYAMLPGGPAGTMCSESLWVANPELPLLCLPGPYQNVGAQEQRGLCSGVRDLAGASPYGARRWPFPTAIYWLEIPHSPWRCTAICQGDTTPARCRSRTDLRMNFR